MRAALVGVDFGKGDFVFGLIYANAKLVTGNRQRNKNGEIFGKGETVTVGNDLLNGYGQNFA